MAQPGTGTLTGIVADPLGALIPGATVTLASPGRPAIPARSDDEGTFRFATLASGNYTLTVEAHGFQTEQQPVAVQPGQPMHLRIGLKIEVQREQVAVSGETLDSSPDRNLGAIVLKGKDLDALSTDPHQLQLQLQAMAGSDAGTQIFVDGFTASKMPPKSSIREVRINENPFSAQYDTTGLGRVEVFTKPGSNKLGGSLSLLGEDSALNSLNPYVQVQPPYASFYSEGDINGPLTKNSSYFFDGDRQDVGAQSFIHAITSSTGPPTTATVSSPQTSTDLGPRFDFQLGASHTISLRYQFGHQTQDNLLQSQLSLLSQGVDTRHTDQTLQFSDIQAYGPHVVNETRFQYVHTNDSTVSRNGSPSILVQGAFNGGGNNLGQLHDGQNQYELQDYLSVSHGDHLLRFGARYRDTQDKNTSTAGFNGEFIFPSINAFEITEAGIAEGLTPQQIRAAGGGASQYSIATGNPAVSVNVADLGVYAEDEWKLRPSMTLTAGVRFETQSRIHDHADFAPRLNYAWSIGAKKDKPATTVLRAGIGIFYQRFTSDLVLNAARQNGILTKQFVINSPDFSPNLSSPGMLFEATLPTIYSISPLLHAPYLVQHTVSIDRQLFKRLSLSLDYSYYRGADLLLTRNINAPLPGTYNPSIPASGTRPLGTLQNIYQYESEGASKRNQLYMSFRYQTNPITLYGYYVYGYRNANTSGAGSFPSNQYDLHADYGRSANDYRNRLYVGTLSNLPLRLQLSSFLVVQSSQPFNITVGQDLNGDSQFNDRPAFATDLSRPSVYRTRWGNFDADPQPGQTIIPINHGSGPALLMLNLGLSRNLSVGPRLTEQPPAPPTRPGAKPQKPEIARRYLLNLGIESQNIFNTVNGGLPIGVLGSPLFGQSTALNGTQFSSQQANRIFYLHMRLDF